MDVPSPRVFIAAGALSLLGIGFVITPPIRQDPAYHVFADQRSLHGIPNFWNVISNIPFFLGALYGIKNLRLRTAFSEPWERSAYVAVLAGTAATSIGSAYYHLHPCDSRLLWDRLPMTVVFMSLLATTIGERLSEKAGRYWLFPMISTGLASVAYWGLTGDLRPYGVIQFGSLLALPLLIALCPPRYSGAGWLWLTIVLYLAAKAAELFDRKIGLLLASGGHPWKHLAAATAIFFYVYGVGQRSGAPAPQA